MSAADQDRFASLPAGEPRRFALARYLLAEAAIGAVINGVLSLVFVWLVFGGRATVSLGGVHGVIIDALPQSFMITLMATLVPSWLSRRRVEAGRVPQQPSLSVPLPRSLPARAIVAAIGVALAGWALQSLLLPIVSAPLWPFRAVLIAKVLYGAALGVAVTLLAVRIALGEDRRPPSRG